MTSATPVPTDDDDEAATEVIAAIRSLDWARAFRLADGALLLGRRHPRLYQARAIGREREGRIDEAISDLELASALAPRDPGIDNALAVCLTRAGRTVEASVILRASTAAFPAIPDSWFNLGVALTGAGDLEDARRAFELAGELDPRRAETFGRLASLASHRGDGVEAARLADIALALDPADPFAFRALIESTLDGGRYAEAESYARDWIGQGRAGPNGLNNAYGLLGDALEGQGRFDEAFIAYRESNAAFRLAHKPAFGRQDEHPLSETLRQMQADFMQVGPARWTSARDAKAAASVEAPRIHVFLMGYMRSGTTLLEQALASSPDVVSMEEAEAFANAGASLLSAPGGMAAIANLSDAQVADYRAAYWSAVLAQGRRPTGKVFIDKLPFNGIKLPLIAKLFPEAKIVFAVRDPRDVTISCFQRRFRPSAYTYEMATLEGGARLYAHYMSLVAAYRRALPLDIFDHRHETLVDDLSTSVRAVCGHIGLAFDPSMIDFGVAAARGRVVSQTSRQLGEGLSRRGVGRWRPYAGALEPVFPILDPWIRRFGYYAD